MEWKYDIIISIVKTHLDTVIHLGGTLLLSFLPLAILITYLGVMRNRASWADLFLRVVIGFIILQNYEYWMDSIRNIVVDIINTVTPNDFVNEYMKLVDDFQQKYAEQQAANPWEAIQNFLKHSVTTFVINLSFLFYSIATFVMNTVRYVFAALLYKIGPLLVPFILFQSTGKIIGGWLTSYISVLFWPLLWRIMLSIAVDQGHNIDFTADGLSTFVVFNLAVAVMIVFSPLIMTSISAGLGVGFVSSLTGAMATRGTFDVLRQTGEMGIKGTAGTINAVGKSIDNKSEETNTLSQRLNQGQGTAGTDFSVRQTEDERVNLEKISKHMSQKFDSQNDKKDSQSEG